MSKHSCTVPNCIICTLGEAAKESVTKQWEFMANNAGININIKEVNKKHARSIGKFPSRLTKAEETQAFHNACVEQGLKHE